MPHLVTPRFYNSQGLSLSIVANDSGHISQYEAEFAKKVGKKIIEIGSYNNSRLIPYLQRNKGHIIIDLYNSLQLSKQHGEISLIGKNHSFIQGLTFDVFDAEYHGQEGCPPEYIKAFENFELDERAPILFFSLMPDFLLRNADKFKTIIYNELIRDLDFDEDEEEMELEEKPLIPARRPPAHIPDYAEPEVKYPAKFEPTPPKTEADPYIQPTIIRIPRGPTAHQLFIRRQADAAKPFEKYAPLQTEFKQTVPYLHVTDKEFSGHEVNDVYATTSMLVQEAIHQTPIEDYLKTWKGSILLDLHTVTKSVLSGPMKIGFSGYKNRFHHQGKCPRSEHPYLENSSFEYVPLYMQNNINHDLGYPAGSSYLYLSISPDFLKEQMEKLPKLLKNFVSDVSINPSEMDVEKTVFHVPSIDDTPTSKEYIIPAIEDPSFQVPATAMTGAIHGYRYNLEAYFSDKRTQDFITENDLVNNMALTMRSMGVETTKTEIITSLATFQKEHEQEICSFEETVTQEKQSEIDTPVLT